MVYFGVFNQPHAFTADHLVGNIYICLQGTDFLANTRGSLNSPSYLENPAVTQEKPRDSPVIAR